MSSSILLLDLARYIQQVATEVGVPQFLGQDVPGDLKKAVKVKVVYTVDDGVFIHVYMPSRGTESGYRKYVVVEPPKLPPELLRAVEEKLATVFYANTVKEAADLVTVSGKLAEEGLMIPAVILDDAAVVLSRYSQVPWASDKETMRLATEFVKYFQISREGVGCIVVISPPNMLVKGVRDRRHGY